MNTLGTVKHSAPYAVFPNRPALFGVAGGAPIGMTPVVAHQGGWDEILLVVAPLAVIGGLLWLANRRVTAQLENELQTGGNGSEAGDSTVAETNTNRRPSGDHGQD